MSETTLTVDKEKLEVRMLRIFDASREKLWQAHTNPNFIPQWWGPRDTTTYVDKMEVKEGGSWRFIHKDREGNQTAFFGIFKQLKEPEEITWTFNYEPLGLGHELVETVKFEETEDGQTKVSTVSHYKNIADLEGMVSSGMEKGARETWDRLGELLVAQKQHGKMNPVVHFEMPQEDKNRVSDFYAKVFGWEMEITGPEYGDYVLAMTTKSDRKGPKRAGAINGGFFKKDQSKPDQVPSVVIEVIDINESMKMVKDAGGEVLGEPMEIPKVGLYVSFRDTEGNRASMLQPFSP